MPKVTCYIDESGQAGIRKIRTEDSGGASPYMTMGGVIVRNAEIPTTKVELLNLAEKLNRRDLHASQLKHEQKVLMAKTLNSLNFRSIGVISRKATLGDYSEDISKDSQMYYNKCTQYLLERLGHFCSTRKIDRDDVSVVFERANFDYSKMFNFIRTIQRNPLNRQAEYLQGLKVENFQVQTKSEEELLALSDFVAHALFRCVDRTQGNYFIAEPRYLNEMGGRFFGCPDTNKVLGYGIKAIHDLRQLDLVPEALSAILELESDLSNNG